MAGAIAVPETMPRNGNTLRFAEGMKARRSYPAEAKSFRPGGNVMALAQGRRLAYARDPQEQITQGEDPMELFEIMRTTFAAREFTDAPLPDDTLLKILDHARFAPSGGNRQGWSVVVVRDPETRRALARLAAPAARRYAAQVAAGEQPWNAIDPTKVDAGSIERTPVPQRLIDPLLEAAVVLVVCVDLKVVASLDQDLDRVGVVSGASIYPFAWNILLAARHEGFAGTITTMAVAEEPEVQQLLGIPEHVAVAAIMPLGRPVRRVAKLRRKPVSDFARLDRWDGPPLAGPRT
jgi:nitroreductase